ncbi:MAG: HNH endonuclease [Caulobacterales bacterium]|nr:HNH endonuclease [Caulobacterales bacterium]
MPTRYSPISAETGKGHQKVYLAEIEREAFDVIIANAAYDHASLLNGGDNSLTYYVVSELLDDAVERAVEADFALEDTVRKSIVLARRGQGRFRMNVEALEPACRVTGVTDPTLLIASHIKPWRLCLDANERLDGMNGLMLTPDVDLLFDRGFISFDDDGGVRVSSRVRLDDLGRLGLGHLAWNSTGFAEAPAIWNAEEFRPKQREYLGFHRSVVFLP